MYYEISLSSLPQVTVTCYCYMLRMLHVTDVTHVMIRLLSWRQKVQSSPAERSRWTMIILSALFVNILERCITERWLSSYCDNGYERKREEAFDNSFVSVIISGGFFRSI